MSNLVVWCVDLSTYQTLGSDWVRPSDPIPPDFRYEPWESVLDMLERWYDESPFVTGFYTYVGDFWNPEVITFEPGETGVLDRLHEHGPAGWYEFTDMVQGALYYAQLYGRQFNNVTILLANRGPVMTFQERRIPDFVEIAQREGVRISIVPMGNEPGNRLRFPYLRPLRRLALETGGKVYYDPDLNDTHNFSMLEGFVPQIIDDLD